MMAKPSNKKVLKAILIIVFSIFCVAVLYELLPYIFQLLGIPSLVIASNSMEHKPNSTATFENFWKNITPDYEKMPWKKGANIGDLLIFDYEPKKYVLGDIVLSSGYADGYSRTHRLFQYSGTAFGDIPDACLSPNRSRIERLVNKGVDFTVFIPGDTSQNASQVFDGPDYLRCARMNVNADRMLGRVTFILPYAGLLHRMLYPLDVEGAYNITLQTI